MSGLELVAGSKDEPHSCKAESKEGKGHAKAESYGHVGCAVEAPAEAADEIHDRVEQRERAPARWQHVDRVEDPAQERQRRDNEKWDHLKLLEAFGPDADHESEKAKGDGKQQHEAGHPNRVHDIDVDEQV